jgi:hypothetical protein
MEKMCAKCGNTDEADIRFCTKCGEPYPVPRKAVEEDSFSEEEEQAGDEEGGMRKTTLNKKWRIVNSSSTMVVGAQGKQDVVVNGIKKVLQELATPNLRVEHHKVTLSGISGMFTKGRKKLVIKNMKMRGYHVFVSIEDYGKQLNVSWYLMLKENWLTRLLQSSYASAFGGYVFAPVIFVAKIFYSGMGYTIPELMNMFDIEELTAYTTTVHHAIKEAVDALVKEANLNPAKVSWQTRGFLNIT